MTRLDPINSVLNKIEGAKLMAATVTAQEALAGAEKWVRQALEETKEIIEQEESK